MTKCTKLTSLNVHCCLNDVMRTNDAHQIRRFFYKRLTKHAFDTYFRGVQYLHRADERIHNRYKRSPEPYQLYAPLQRWAVEHSVAEPNVSGYGNVLNEATKLYYTCFHNNIWMHAKQRMRKFCHLTLVCSLQQHQQQQQPARPTKSEVERTLRFLFYDDDQSGNVQPNQSILNEFHNRLLIPNGLQAPRNTAAYHGYFWNMKEHTNWYR